MIYYDNVGATNLFARPSFHSCMKHVVLDYHFICDQVQNGLLEVVHVSAADQLQMSSQNHFHVSNLDRLYCRGMIEILEQISEGIKESFHKCKFVI